MGVLASPEGNSFLWGEVEAWWEGEEGELGPSRLIWPGFKNMGLALKYADEAERWNPGVWCVWVPS